MVSVKYAPKDAPTIRNGRWTWLLASIENETLINQIINQGIKTQEKIEEIANTPIEQRYESPQIIWKEFKNEIRATTKKEARKEKYKITTKIRLLEGDIKSVMNNPEVDENENLRTEIAFLTSQLNQMQKKVMKEQCDEMKAKIAHQRERPRGIWSAINKEKKPRDLIPRLKIPSTNPTQYERSSARMAELARNYHCELQSTGINQRTEEGREEQIKNALAFVPRTQQLEDPEMTPLNRTAQQKHVNRAINLA